MIHELKIVHTKKNEKKPAKEQSHQPLTLQTVWYQTNQMKLFCPMGEETNERETSPHFDTLIQPL